MERRRAVDDLLPYYDVNEVHCRRYAADPAAVRCALESLRPADLPFTRALFAVRLVPARIAGRDVRRDERTLTDRMAESGFARLVDEPDEAVFAVVGRFWRSDGGRLPAIPDADAFRSFAEPGYAKAVMSFELWPCDGGTELCTETRVYATSLGARRAFRAYWAVVGAGSALIRREMLAAVAARLKG